MKTGIVRALWGDVLHQRHAGGKPPDGYYSILREARDSVTVGEQTDRVYCWGKQNFEFARWLGLPARLMGLEPYDVPIRSPDRGPSKQGMIVWGSNHFMMKWLMLEAALEEFDAVVNVDWDLQQRQKVKDRFWQEQAEAGAPFRAGLAVQPNWTWGAYWRRFRRRRMGTEENGLWGAQHVPYMGCMWIGCREFVQKAKAIHFRKPTLMCQQIVAMLLDEPNGMQWMGVEEYRKRGYSADFVALVNGLEKPNARNVVWQNIQPRFGQRRRSGRDRKSHQAK